MMDQMKLLHLLTKIVIQHFQEPEGQQGPDCSQTPSKLSFQIPEYRLSVKNASTKHNKYVVNQNPEQFDV
jgi:hypothetical protein